MLTSIIHPITITTVRGITLTVTVVMTIITLALIDMRGDATI